MSKAGDAFYQSIKDAETMLERFDAEKHNSKAVGSEILKRAGMVIALASWETYVKDRFREEVNVWLLAVNGSQLADFVHSKVEEDLKRFFNPNYERTKQLFKAYFFIDITEGWKWDNYEPALAKKVLNKFISIRGDAAHQACTETNASHIVKRDDLEKAIRFLKGLVKATECVKIAK